MITIRSDGNVGIGTTIPTQKLHVNGTISILGYLINNYLFNNTGNNHGDITDFSAVTDFGYRYIFANTNGPGTGGQYYSWAIGLGINLSIATHACQFAIPRYATDPVMSVRFREAGTWGSWGGITAAALTSGNKTINGNLTTTGTISCSGTTLTIGSSTSASTLYLTDIAAAAWKIETGGYNLNFTNNNGGSFANKMLLTNTGRVGIGTLTPVAGLEVSTIVNNTSYAAFNVNRFTISQTLAVASITGFTDLAAKFNGSIWVTSWIASSSDIRIKKNIQDINDNSALLKIIAIEPKTYNYIDAVDKGYNTVYGFIAQQIKEIIPEAVTIEKSIIPNIYSFYDCSSNIINITSNIEKIKLNDTLSIFQENIDKKNYTVTEIIPESNQIRINENLEGSNCFVYGTEVNDFHALNKDYIFTLNVCATQELHRIIQLQQQQIDELKTRIEILESR